MNQRRKRLKIIESIEMLSNIMPEKLLMRIMIKIPLHLYSITFIL